MRAANPDPPLAQYRLDGLAPRLHEGVKVGDRVVGAIALSLSDAAGQEAVVGSAQRVVVTRAQAPRMSIVERPGRNPLCSSGNIPGPCNSR